MTRYLWTGDLLTLPGKCYARRNLMCTKAIFSTVNTYDLDYIFFLNNWNVIYINMIFVNNGSVYSYTTSIYIYKYEIWTVHQGTRKKSKIYGKICIVDKLINFYWMKKNEVNNSILVYRCASHVKSNLTFQFNSIFFIIHDWWIK